MRNHYHIFTVFLYVKYLYLRKNTFLDPCLNPQRLCVAFLTNMSQNLLESLSSRPPVAVALARLALQLRAAALGVPTAAHDAVILSADDRAELLAAAPATHATSAAVAANDADSDDADADESPATRAALRAADGAVLATLQALLLPTAAAQAGFTLADLLALYGGDGNCAGSSGEPAAAAVTMVPGRAFSLPAPPCAPLLPSAAAVSAPAAPGPAALSAALPPALTQIGRAHV